ncbi:hypothetical protein CVM73_35075 [Bradyrhizobium forestalis]|uniref:JAB domain-containing protein n=1 Tax=Bradyrhizobium forestalis TaxID=1419263 RepID=A0A2M8QYP4_9BRAD|nr:hypothetical protein CVM73_35075 [Bradyrhizobium forestalis]
MIHCSGQVIQATLSFLRAAGEQNSECVVLWLGRPGREGTSVVECYRPHQLARADRFQIPVQGMDMLRAKLRSERLMVAAQVHSHPQDAFHSKADDAWAIVRHEGALSLVVPRFARDTFPENFLAQTKVYRFSNAATWDEVPGERWVQECLRII